MKDKKTLSAIFLIAGFVAMLLTGGHWNIPVMAWIWPFCIIEFVRMNRPVKGILITFAAVLVSMNIKLFGLMGIGFAVDFAMCTFQALACTIPFLVDRLLYDKISTKGAKGYLSSLLLPLTAVSMELLVNKLGMSSFCCMGVTQEGNLPIEQILSITGIFGLSFLIYWCGSTLAFVFENAHAGLSAKATGENFCSSCTFCNVKRPLIIFTCVLLACFTYGGGRLALSHDTGETVRVASVTGPYVRELSEGEYERLDFETNLKSLKRSVKTAAKGGAEILSTCEEAYNISDEEEPVMLEEISKLAKEKEICVLVSLEIYDADDEDAPSENKNVMIDKNGDVVWEYMKTMLVPVLETSSYVKGDGNIPMEKIELASGSTVNVSGVICLDSDHPVYIRTMDSRADMLLVPSWDWAALRAFHTHSVSLRAIENGVSLLKTTYDGSSAAFDSCGRTLMFCDTDQTGYEYVSFAEMPIEGKATFYGSVGEIMNWIYVVGLAILVVLAIRRKIN